MGSSSKNAIKRQTGKQIWKSDKDAWILPKMLPVEHGKTRFVWTWNLVGGKAGQQDEVVAWFLQRGCMQQDEVCCSVWQRGCCMMV